VRSAFGDGFAFGVFVLYLRWGLRRWWQKK